MADEQNPAGHPNGPGRESRNSTEQDGLLIRNNATGETARYSTQIALAEIERGNAELIEE
jgi:hypothetical protein